MLATETSSAGTLPALSQQQRIATGACTLLPGSFLLTGFGSAPSDVIHKAAHDTRHAFSRPCH